MSREAHDDVRHLQARPAIVSCGLEITGMGFPRVPAHKATAGDSQWGAACRRGKLGHGVGLPWYWPRCGVWLSDLGEELLRE
jgi:hypothetical protein